MTRNQSDARDSSMSSESQFRSILLRELESDGIPAERARRLVFRTPERFHELSGSGAGLDRLVRARADYRHQLPLDWYYEGLEEQQSPPLPATGSTPTFVVVPGIFGEFIHQLPFQEALGPESSGFARQWTPVLEKLTDERYRLTDLASGPCQMSDVLRLGGVEAEDGQAANLVVCSPAAGSLETLGTLEQGAAVIIRRLDRLFEAIDDESDLYLIGYSRGLALALHIVSTLHEEAAERSWFGRLKGVVGLGGVFYGAQFADDVLAGRAGATSDLVQLLRDTSSRLGTVPADASIKEKASTVAANARTWADFVGAVHRADTPRTASGSTFLDADVDEAFANEAKLRLLGRDLPAPSPFGIWSVVNQFFLQTFDLKNFVGRYNENIEAFKLLVDRVLAGVGTLTPVARDEWWRTRELPSGLRLLSITGTMPDAHLDGLRTPLWEFEGYGVRTADYNVSLRSAFYETMVSEQTMLNDSQVAHAFARYWPDLYPGHACEHHYLGILGTHHWGMAFPYAIEDDAKVGANPFPRTALLRALASYVASL